MKMDWKAIAAVAITASLAVAGSALAMGSLKGKNESNQPVQATPAEEQGKQRVTFIELGSVNCVPCRMMQPVMDEIGKEYGERVKMVFYDVWTEAGSPYARQYQIRAIPTQVFLDQDNQEFFRHTGFFSKAEIVKVLEKQGVK